VRGVILMDKNLQITILMDFYGQLLTEKQTEALDLYYNSDLSLSEIAEMLGISRQGARDFIKRGEKQLQEFENALGLAKKLQIVQDKVIRIKEIAHEKDITDDIKEEIIRISDDILNEF